MASESGIIQNSSTRNGVPSVDYINAVHTLQRLEEQGDGVRSYLGLFLHILAGAHSVTLIDEPEAFLHPPQARRLGELLAARASASQQLFLATHSADVLQGVLSASANVTIVRLQRDGDVNKASVLSPDAVRNFWDDPLLRYSNLLDGLFHDAVVICESDADCRYYASVLDSLRGAEEESGLRPLQILFAHCGGKARMDSVVRALRAVSIPVVAVADFDVLNDSTLVERIVRALRGDFEAVKPNLTMVQNALSSDTKPVPRLALKDELNRRLDDFGVDSLDKKHMESLRSLLKVESGWDKVKRAGKEAVPQGDAYGKCVDLLAQLEGIGLLVVPVGELERFVPAVGGHGPAWVTEVHRRGLHNDPGNQPPRDFVAAMLAAAQRPLDLN